MRHLYLDFPDLPLTGFRAALGKNRPATLEKSTGNTPQAPNPYTTAGAQTSANNQAALFNKLLNLPNYSTPFGSHTSGVSGTDPVTGAPIIRSDVSLSPQMQQFLNSAMGGVNNALGASQNAQNALGGIANQFGNYQAGLFGISPAYSNYNTALAGLSSQLDNGAALNAQQKGQEAAYQAQKQYLDPQYAQQEESLGAKLAAQGLAPGSEAYNRAMTNFNNQRQQAYSNAQNQAIMTGSQLGAQNLQNQLAGINAQAGLIGQQAGNTNQQAGLYNLAAQMLGQQGNAIGQGFGYSQIPFSQMQSLAQYMPGYQAPANAGTNPADIASAINNQFLGQLGQYNAQQQARNATNSSLAGLAGGLLNAYRGGSTLNGLFGGGGGLGNYGSMLSSVSPGAAGALGDLFGTSIGGVYGPSTQAGLDALIGSFSGGSGATAAGTGAAGAGAAGVEGAGAGVGTGAGLGGLAGFGAVAAIPILGMLGAFDDNGTPYTRANDAWTNAILKDPSLLQRFGQGDISGYMQGMFGGNQWTPEQYQRAQDMLSAASGGGSFFGNFLGAPEQGMGG